MAGELEHLVPGDSGKLRAIWKFSESEQRKETNPDLTCAPHTSGKHKRNLMPERSLLAI